MALNEWPAALRAAGIQVKVHDEVGRLSHGAMRDTNIVWHHDASPAGDSPGALGWMKSNWKNASAQIWVDRYGVWHFISYGVAYHAGAVNDARFNNWNAVGIETDHTTGEGWPDAQLSSLRAGTAVALRHEGKSSASLNFHKNICVPPGRKSDPAGLDLGSERQVVQALINGGPTFGVAATPSQEDFLMALNQYDQELTRNVSVEAVEILRSIDARLRVPGQPFDWLPAINNNIVGLYGGGGEVDVDKLAESLKASLAEDIVKSLAEKLSK